MLLVLLTVVLAEFAGYTASLPQNTQFATNNLGKHGGFINLPSQPPPINQNGLIGSLGQPGFSQNSYGKLQDYSGVINQNGLVNLQIESSPVNQNGLINLPGQPSPINQNSFANLSNQQGPVNQNGFISLSNRATPLPVNQNSFVNLPGQPAPFDINSFVNLPGQPGPVSRFNYENAPINQNAYVNTPSRSRGITPNSLTTVSGVDATLPINQNSYVKSLFPGPSISQSSYERTDYINSVPLSSVTNENRYFNPSGKPPSVTQGNSPLEVAVQWRFLDWVHPTVQYAGKNFTVGNPLSQDVDIDRRGRIFVTSPQWLEGTPITLSLLTDLQGPGGPLLTPYPDWTWHIPNCDSLVSVYRIAIDECDRLWMVDTGFVSGESVCPSKIVVFNLKTDQLLFKYVIPEDQTLGRTASYVTPIVEVGATCNDAYLYVADVLKHGLLIYNLRENRSWRLNNTRGNAFGHNEEATNLTIAGETFDLTDGTLGISLSPPGFFNKRYLYFNSLASYYQKFGDADSLKRSYVYEPIVFQSINKRISQAGAQAISKTGAIFFQLAEYTALACWNIERPFSNENVVVLAQDEVALQYISGIKVIINEYGEEELWFNTNRLQRTINKTRKINEVNFRLIRGKVDELIRGTRCAPTGYRQAEPSLVGWLRT